MRLIYVTSAGRSGSTLLDILLGNHVDIHGAGEVAQFALRNNFHTTYCTCRRPVPECQFWTSVVGEWFSRTGLRSLEEHGRLRKQFDGPRLKGLARLLREKFFRSSAFRQYSEQTTEFYRAIGKVSGKSMIVDSSCMPVRAYALAQMPGIDLRVIHLVRDGRGVACSLKKRVIANPKAGVGADEFPRAVWRSAITWGGYNLLANWVCRQVPKQNVFFLRYEDLVCDTCSTLRHLASFLECDFSQVIQHVQLNQPLKVGCTFGGNRMRMKDDITLRYDEDWSRLLSHRERRLFLSLCGGLMRGYGYKA